VKNNKLQYTFLDTTITAKERIFTTGICYFEGRQKRFTSAAVKLKKNKKKNIKCARQLPRRMSGRQTSGIINLAPQGGSLQTPKFGASAPLGTIVKNNNNDSILWRS
jgi:hypothetical protein